MHQKWGKLLFMHWRIEERLLRPLIPAKLEIDTFDGSAWIGVVPFTMWDIRALPPYVPRLPGLNAMHELNVRTYVHYQGVPGVWFFSLDCNNAVAVFGARSFYYLPYFKAKIELQQFDRVIDYNLVRSEDPVADFSSTWEMGETLPVSQTDSLEFFLTERYCLYSARAERLYRSRIFHDRWRLQKARVKSYASSMVSALRLPEPEGEPLLHYAEELAVDIWALRQL